MSETQRERERERERDPERERERDPGRVFRGGGVTGSWGLGVLNPAWIQREAGSQWA